MDSEPQRLWISSFLSMGEAVLGSLGVHNRLSLRAWFVEILIQTATGLVF